QRDHTPGLLLGKSTHAPRVGRKWRWGGGGKGSFTGRRSWGTGPWPRCRIGTRPPVRGRGRQGGAGTRKGVPATCRHRSWKPPRRGRGRGDRVGRPRGAGPGARCGNGRVPHVPVEVRRVRRVRRRGRR